METELEKIKQIMGDFTNGTIQTLDTYKEAILLQSDNIKLLLEKNEILMNKMLHQDQQIICLNNFNKQLIIKLEELARRYEEE